MRRTRRNTEMKLTVFSSLLLACLLVITLNETSARVVSGGKEGNKNKLEVTSIYAQKESIERSGAGHMRKLGFGRTMHHEETSVDSENGKETPKISGKEDNGLKKTFGSYQAPKKNDHQKHMTMGSSSKSDQQIFEEPVQKDETQSPIDAEKEMESLLFKDYKGRPAHKPPINNHKPNN